MEYVLTVLTVLGDCGVCWCRFGFYIFWGCTAFLPSFYTLTSLFLTTHPVQWTTGRSSLIFASGICAVFANYDSDRQRQRFRSSGGKEMVWGRAPRVIHAKYITGDGVTRTSILLASGWWGIARHINYLFEILLAFFWSLPAGNTGTLPYAYVAFLTVLLTDRAYRDEIRCTRKYGIFYEQYCKLVPYRMIPGIY